MTFERNQSEKRCFFCAFLQDISKKGPLVFSLIILVLLVSLNFCTSREGKDIHADKRSMLKDFYGNLYYRYDKKITFKFDSIGSTLLICDRPGETSKTGGSDGTIGIYLQIVSKGEDIVTVLKKKNGRFSLLKTLRIKKGFNEMTFQVPPYREKCLFIKNKSGAKMLFAKPVVYKRYPGMPGKYIFLVAADTLSAYHMGLYGYGNDTTPHIDTFARDAVVFTNAYTNSSWTLSSFMSLFTSLYEHKHGAKRIELFQKKKDAVSKSRNYIVSLETSTPFLVENLSKTFVSFGFNEGGFVSPVYGFYRGFAQYNIIDKSDEQRRAKTLFETARKHIETFQFPAAFYFLHTYHVHTPYYPEEKFLKRISNMMKIKIKKKTFDLQEDLGGKPGIFNPVTLRSGREITALYDAEILGYDHYFGEFIRFLKAGGIYDSSMIVLFSDHGEEFFEHKSWIHGTDLYNQQVKVPVIIKFPHQAFKGKTIHTNISLVDIFPTICDYYRADLPGNLEGVSLMPVIEHDAPVTRPVITSIYRSKGFQMIPGKIAIIEDNFKLIYNEPYTPEAFQFFVSKPPDLPRYELYNLAVDAGESDNLFYKPGNNHRRTALLTLMKALVTEMEKHASIKPAKLKRKKISKELRQQLKSLGYID